MASQLSPEAATRHNLQWVLLFIVVVTLAFGWKYTLLGFTVPTAMMTSVVGGFFRGRYVCGNLCPRGSFADRLLSIFSFRKPIPAFFKSMTFRWPVLVALMSFMLFQMIQKTDEMDWVHHIGKVFWRMCAITTAVAVMFGILIHQRTWCTFCPIGTLANVFGRGKYLIQINSKVCKECKTCERACSMGLSILPYKQEGKMRDPDCIKCSECVWACPKKALSFSKH